jgi:hypothetical protein
MSTWVQIALVALGFLGAAGTWLRAYVAWRTMRANEKWLNQ